MLASARIEAIGVFGVDDGADFLDLDVGLGEIFAAGAVALDQVGNGVEPQSVDAHVEPEAHGVEDLFHDARVVEVEVGLVGEEAMPVVLLARLSSQVQLDFSVSVKMMRTPS